jgi:HEAT repeat protein
MRRWMDPIALLVLTGSLAAADPAGDSRRSLAAGPLQQRLLTLAQLRSQEGFEASVALAEALADREMPVAEAARAALCGRPNDHLARLAEPLARSRNPAVRAAGAELAGALPVARACRLLETLAGDTDAGVRVEVVRRLQAMPAPAGTVERTAWASAWGRVLAVGTMPCRRAAVEALAQALDPAWVRQALPRLLRDQPEEIADLAMRRLIEAGTAAAELVPALGQQLCRDPKPANRVLAANALALVPGNEAVTALLDGLATQKGRSLWEVRAAIADALGIAPPAPGALATRTERTLATLLDDGHWGVRLAAAWALGRLGSSLAVPGVVARLHERQAPAYMGLLREWTGLALDQPAAWSDWLARTRPPPVPPAGGPLPPTSPVSFFSLAAETASVAYILDISASMNDPWTGAAGSERARELPTRYLAARQELWRSLCQLHPPTRFALTLFAGEAQPWSQGSVVAGWRARAQVWELLEATAPRGGTNAGAALRLALDESTADAVFFLTDGMPSVGDLVEPDAILADLRERRARQLGTPPSISTLGFLVPEAGPFLDGLARDHGGHSATVGR